MTRGAVEEVAPGEAAPADGHHGTDLVARPSPWAALDVPFRAFGTLAVLAFPVFFTGGVVFRDPLAALTLFTLFEVLQIAPAFLLAFAPAVRILFTRYHIDDEGIRISVQVLARSESRVSWDKVTAIRHRITLVDRLLNIERLDIIAYGERGATMRLVGLRQARIVRDIAAKKMRTHASLGSLLASD